MNIQAINSACSLLACLDIPGAIIAGGTVRDAVLDREVKDFDLYVSNSADGMSALRAMFPAMSVYDHTENGGDEYEANDELLTVYEANARYHGFPVQIMVLGMHEPVTYVRDVFDFGICKAYVSNVDGVVLLPDFLDDVREKTITFYPSDWNWYSVDRAQRLKAKYPEYTVIA